MALPEHVPVLMKEVMDALAPQTGETAVDCTVGMGGHAGAIWGRIKPSGHIIGFDLDPANVAHGTQVLRQAGADNEHFLPIHASFVVSSQQIKAKNLRADL